PCHLPPPRRARAAPPRPRAAGAGGPAGDRADDRGEQAVSGGPAPRDRRRCGVDALISAVTACVVSVLSACIVIAVLAAFDRWSARGRRAEHAVVGAPTGDR